MRAAPRRISLVGKPEFWYDTVGSTTRLTGAAPAPGNFLYQSLPPEAKAQVDAVVETINRHA